MIISIQIQFLYCHTCHTFPTQKQNHKYQCGQIFDAIQDENLSADHQIRLMKWILEFRMCTSQFSACGSAEALMRNNARDGGGYATEAPPEALYPHTLGVLAETHPNHIVPAGPCEGHLGRNPHSKRTHKETKTNLWTRRRARCLGKKSPPPPRTDNTMHL